MRFVSHFGTVLLGVVSFSADLAAAPDDEAVAVIARLHGAIVAMAADQSASDLEQRIQALAPVIAATHDLESMGQSTVRRFWRNWDDDQRRQFLATFERLSVTTYASRFGSVGPDVFEILGGEVSDGADAEARVHALIHRPDDEPVAIDYDLEYSDGSWRIVQVYADRVSDLSLMRSEYYEILGSGDFDELIAAIESDIAAH
jgi:phospholipid transport system substrate-binding protein